MFLRCRGVRFHVHTDCSTDELSSSVIVLLVITCADAVSVLLLCIVSDDDGVSCFVPDHDVLTSCMSAAFTSPNTLTVEASAVIFVMLSMSCASTKLLVMTADTEQLSSYRQSTRLLVIHSLSSSKTGGGGAG